MLTQLKEHHREIARLKVEGFSVQDIADMREMNIQSVYAILRDPLCKAHIAKLQDAADETAIDVRKRLVEMNKKALDKIEDCLDREEVPFATGLKAAESVLDRNGYAPPKQDTSQLHLHVTSEDLNELKERMRKAKQRGQGHIVDDPSECIDIKDDDTQQVM